MIERVLVMTSVPAEREVVLRGLGNCNRFDVELAGVGSVVAAVNTATILATQAPYDLVVSAGIAGGFLSQAEVGSIVVADEIIAADLGAETPEGFLSLDELGFGSIRLPISAELVSQVVEALKAAGLPVTTGSVLSVSTVTGTSATASVLATRIPRARAEAMEGYGVAMAAQRYGLPFLEIRTISNQVGPRDRSAWRISEALEALEAASSVLREVF